MKRWVRLAIWLVIVVSVGAGLINYSNAQESPRGNSKDIVIQATATQANQTLKINKYFSNSYTVDWGDGTPVNDLMVNTVHTYATSGTYTVTLSTTADRWRFIGGSNYNPLIPVDGTTMTGVKITYMPSLADGFGNSATAPGNNFFFYFNYNGAITSLPEGSFDTSYITVVGKSFFDSFDRNGLLTSLPEGSFRTENIVKVGDYFFSSFNRDGFLTTLPNGSFKISTGLTDVGNYFFNCFNYGGMLASLPEGSFDISNITAVGDYFFSSFNSNGSLTNLLESFILSSVGASTLGGYKDAFNSLNYTLNKKVSDLVSGVTVPPYDMNTFSNNQLGRCGVHENWLVTKANACSIKYSVNIDQPTYITSGQSVTGFVSHIDRYDADFTGVDILPELTTDNYVFEGWYTHTGYRVDKVTFPDMDATTIHAHWSPVLYTITFDTDGGSEIAPISLAIGSGVQIPEPPTKEGYKFIGWDIEIPSNMPAENITVTAKWEEVKKETGKSNRSGGGKKKDDCPNGDFSGSEYDGECGEAPHGSADDSTGNVQEPKNDDENELFDMHKWAYDNGLTIYKPGEDAKFDKPLTRQQMAKISSIFGAKFIGQVADDSESKIMECSQYSDLSKSKGDMRGYVIQSCLLGNMGYEYDNVHYIPKFMPYNKLTLAQASVIISRMAWGEKYIIDEGHWYQGHMKAVYDNGLIDDIKDPKRVITRGEAFLMLYRLDKMMNGEK